MMNANHIKARRIDFLQSKLEELASRKQRLTTVMSSGSLSKKSYRLWAKRLECVVEDMHKYSAALAEYEQCERAIDSEGGILSGKRSRSASFASRR
ncbi:hypothetical protein [Occallatibacter savannae]|uniref:hypothetical protein n=1 Tax=Occallatibacter savannae TaxID=1002691 RepID=UPI000D6A0492|nr:hypothetical protein [Occallatibacter savannae]